MVGKNCSCEILEYIYREARVSIPRTCTIDSTTEAILGRRAHSTTTDELEVINAQCCPELRISVTYFWKSLNSNQTLDKHGIIVAHYTAYHHVIQPQLHYLQADTTLS